MVTPRPLRGHRSTMPLIPFAKDQAALRLTPVFAFASCS